MRIYVGNLPVSITEETLAAAFGVYGRIDRVEMVVDRGTGRSRGFAFVTLPDDDEGRVAITQLNGVEIGNRPIAVSEAQPDTGHDHGSRRGGGRW